MCRHTVERPGALVVTDTTADDRFRDNVFVRGPLADLRRAQAEAEILCF